MSQSLSPQCTTLKTQYDNCFNSWFAGYLEPAVAAGKSTGARAAYSKQKADEFQQKCGKVWDEYRECVQLAVKSHGLDTLLEQARKANPLVDPIPPLSSTN